MSRPRRPPVAAQIQALLARLHFYGGLLVAPFILLAALTGGLYAMSPTIESFVYRSVLEVPASAEQVPLQDQILAAQQTHPDLTVAQIWPSDKAGDPTRILFNDPNIEADEQRAVFVDPGTGRVIGDLPSYSGLGELPLRRWVSGLHENLHLGEPGFVYSELAASWLWFLVLGGTFLWWRSVRRRKRKLRGPIPRMLRGLPSKKGSRVRAMNLHAITGSVVAVVLIGLSLTGITWSNTAGKSVNTIVAEMNWKATPIATKVSAAETVPLDTAGQATRVLQTARAEGLTGPLRLYPPTAMDGGWKASELWVPGRVASDQISVAGATGRTIARQDFADLPTFSKLSSWGIYLHMGTMFGLPLQITLLAVAMAIVAIVVMGYRMWWKRRPTRGGMGTALGTWKAVGWPVRIGALVIALPIGWLLPYWAFSLALFIAIDAAIQASKRPKLS